MGTPGLIALRQFSFRQFAVSDFRCQFLDLAPLPDDAALVHAADDLASVCQDILPSQEFDSLPQRVDVRLFVEGQPHPVYFRGDFLQRVFEHRPVAVNQNEIVHVPDVVLDAKPFLDVMVKIVQHSQLNQLAGLASKPNAAFSAERIDDARNVHIYTVILDPLSDCRLGGIMGRGREIFCNIALLYPSVAAVFIEVFPQMHAHALVGE